MFGPGVISISNDVKENETTVDGETEMRSNIRAEYRVWVQKKAPGAGVRIFDDHLNDIRPHMMVRQAMSDRMSSMSGNAPDSENPSSKQDKTD
jgi:hypothetical protein